CHLRRIYLWHSIYPSSNSSAYFNAFLMILFFLNAPAPTEIYTLSLHDALPISKRITATVVIRAGSRFATRWPTRAGAISRSTDRSEEHTSELQSRGHLVCRLLLEKKNKTGTFNPDMRMLFATARSSPMLGRLPR